MRRFSQTLGEVPYTNRYRSASSGDSSHGCSKSECIRFVHSRGYLLLVCSSEVRDCGRDLGRLIHAGQLVQPWAVVAQGPLDIMDHVTSALPFMVARTFVVHIPKSPLNRVRSGTIRR